METFSSLNQTCLANFVLCVTSLRIIVLTWNRPSSVRRLLTSLENSSYTSHSWNIVLEIHVDGGGGLEGEEVRKEVESFQFSHGEKILVYNKLNQGLVEAWRNAWRFKADELFVVMEDDAEVSPHWFRWLVNTWLRYGDREDLAGVGLQKQRTTVWPPRSDVDIAARVAGPVFMYEVPASLVASHHPYHWNTFITKHGASMSSCIPSMSLDNCAKNTWEPAWLTFCLKHNLLTLYMANNRSLAVDHREQGYHHQGDLGKDSLAVREWDNNWNKENLPVSPPLLDISLKQLSQLDHTAKKLAKKYGSFSITIITQSDIPYISHQHRVQMIHRKHNTNTRVLSNQKNISKSTPVDNISPLYVDFEEKSLIIVPCPKIRGVLDSFANVVVEPPAYENYNSSFLDKGAYLRQILVSLSRIDVQFWILPPNKQFLKAMITNPPIGASAIISGKMIGQSSPSLDCMYFDTSRFEIKNFLLYLQRVYSPNGTEPIVQLLQSFNDPRIGKYRVAWAWSNGYFFG